eukprot:9734880-Lingulodinium_polyedra.AAC.1
MALDPTADLIKLLEDSKTSAAYDPWLEAAPSQDAAADGSANGDVTTAATDPAQAVAADTCPAAQAL